MSQQFCIFVHIPKTAGTALKDGFIKAMPGRLAWYSPAPPRKQRQILHLSSLDESVMTDISAKVRLVGGHFSVHQLPQILTSVDPLYLAVIRDPVARAKSFYAYVRARTEHGMHQVLKDMTLLEALEYKPFCRQVTNAQISALSPDGDLRNLRKKIQRMRYVIGKYEELQNFLKAMSKHSGIKLDLPRKVNASPADYQKQLTLQGGSDEASGRLRLMNSIEYEFYHSFEKVLVSRRLLLATERQSENGQAGESAPLLSRQNND